MCLLGSPFIALGQDQDDDQETEAGALEEVIITGSRIRQNPLDVRTPVQFFGQEDMELTSSLNAADFLQRQPITNAVSGETSNQPVDAERLTCEFSESSIQFDIC